MVLPDRIELSASPLPRECSTTELRQHLMWIRRPGHFWVWVSPPGSPGAVVRRGDGGSFAIVPHSTQDQKKPINRPDGIDRPKR